MRSLLLVCIALCVVCTFAWTNSEKTRFFQTAIVPANHKTVENPHLNIRVDIPLLLEPAEQEPTYTAKLKFMTNILKFEPKVAREMKEKKKFDLANGGLDSYLLGPDDGEYIHIYIYTYDNNEVLSLT